MSSDTVQQVKDRLSIVDVVSGYVKLQRAGTIMKARCPFHNEKSPSFVVSPDRGTYHCFGCGVGGDIFTFIQEIEGLDFKGALKVLADRAGVEIVYERGNAGEKDAKERLFSLMEAATLFYQSRFDADARAYLNGRGISDDTIKSFRLGLAGNGWSDASDYLRGKGFSDTELVDAGLSKKGERGGLLDKFRNRIMFPIADSAGRIVAFSGRSFGPHASPEAPKYLNSPETPLFHKSRILYGFDKAKQAIRRHDCAVLVEGQVDLVASHQAGWSNAVAVSGTAFTPEHAQLLKRMSDNLVIALDADEAGMKAAGRAARAALAYGLNVKVARLPEGLDPADLILKEGKDSWSAAIRDAKDIVTFLLDVLRERLPQQDRFRRAVETVVLPFLADVQSPIAREQYVRTIAHQLGVSESAVTEALRNMPRAPDAEAPSFRAPAAARPLEPAKERLRQAIGILLWQESLETPALSVREFEQALKDAAGDEDFAALRGLPAAEAEVLRFKVEALYADTARLRVDATLLVSSLLRDRLSRELAEATEALREAERRGDDVAIAAQTAVCTLLTNRIAKMHGVV
ncbi:DNA primase [Candidatus Kaiserbacteria bacterium]|nr:DNA primase [Candidatus Kaiserbacteria bacterium]